MNIPKLDPELFDFRNAIYVIWEHLGLPEPTHLQYDIASFFQDPGDRKLVMAYRGLGKTYLATAWAVHCHRLRAEETGYSDLHTLMISAGKDFADIVAGFAMRLIKEIPFYQCLLPGPDQLTSTVKFDVGPKRPAKDPSFKSAGIFGQTVGSRSNRIILDDLEVPNTAGTVGMREKLRGRVEGIQDLLPTDGGDILVLGTPHFEDSMYSWLADTGGYEVRIYPAQYPSPERAAAMGPSLAPIIREALEADPSLEGSPTDPMRFDEDELRRREASAGKSHYARQYNLDTTLSDAASHPLKLGELIVHDLDREVAPEKLVWGSNPIDDIPVWGLRGDRLNRSILTHDAPKMAPYTGTIMTIDPSGKGTDETAWCVSKILNATIFIPDFGGYLSGFSDATLRGLAESAKEWSVNEILVESNYGGGMFESLLMPHLRSIKHPVIITPYHNSTQKELRICDTLEPLFNQHRIVVDSWALKRDAAPREGMDTEAAMNYRLAYQISRITRERGCLKHDDRLDALATACGHWMTSMATNVDEVLQRQYDEEMDEILRDWPNDTPTSRNWLDGYLPNNMRS